MSLFFTKFVKLDLDPHSFYLLDPEPHSEKLLDPDPKKIECGSTTALGFIQRFYHRLETAHQCCGAGAAWSRHF